MKTHLLREGKKPQFLLVEAGDITLTGKDIASLSRVLGKISPFAGEPDTTKAEENATWLWIIDRLSESDNQKILSALLSNKTMPGWVLEKIPTLYPHLEWHAAKNPSAPPSLLEKIYNIDRPRLEKTTMHLAILENPSSPPAILEKAFDDKYLPHALAANTSLSEEKLEALYDHSPKLHNLARIEITMELASNPSSPRSLLERIERFWSHEKIIEALARNPSSGGKLLRGLAGEDRGQVINSLVMMNPSTPIDVLNDLLTSARPNWHFIARNPSLPPAMISKLYQNNKGDNEVIESIAMNTSTPGHVLEDIYKGFTLSPVRLFSIQTLGMVALNPSTPPGVLEKIAESFKDTFTSSPLYNVASNPSTPIHVLINISRRENPILGEALAKNTRGFSQT